jgi:hypothetical protein
VAALALLLLGGYGYRAVPTQAPRTNADVLAAAPAQAAGIIGNASINVARESRAAFKAMARATVKTVAKQIVASVPALAAPPVKRAAADTSSENGSPGTPRISSTVLTSTAEKAPQQNSGIREQDIANLVLPAALPAQPAMKQEDSQQEKSPKEEPYEQRKVQPPVHVSDLSVEQEVDQQRSILVKYGDTLEKLALRYLGSRYALNEIIDDNPEIIDINRIYPGQKIYLSRSGHTSAGRVASHSSTSFADTSHVGDSGVPGSASAVRSDSR